MLLVVVVILGGVAVRELVAWRHRRPGGPASYWILVAVLVVFGTLTGLTIGLPFLLTGVVLAVMAPYRTRPAVLWPPIVTMLTFIGGFVLVAPLGCTMTISSVSAVGHTTCVNLVGIDYSASASLLPPMLAGMATAVAVGSLSTLWLRRRQGPEG